MLERIFTNAIFIVALNILGLLDFKTTSAETNISEIKIEKIGDVGFIKYVNDKSPQHLFVLEYDKKEILIPINDELIIKIDRKKKLIRMNLPNGLIQLYS